MVVNIRMREKIQAREAIDLKDVPRTVMGDYILICFVEGVDYCDSSRDAWIWSIGLRKADGMIFASTTTEFYQHPDFECLFLR